MAERKSLKTILIGAIVVILAIGLSVGATLFFLQGDKSAETSVAASGDAEEAAVPAVPVIYFSFEKPFITTVAQGDRSRYMQVFMALATHDPVAEAGLKTHLPLLRSRLLTLLGSGDFLTLQTEAGRQALKAEALAMINGVLEQEGVPAVVEQVLFTNFVLQ